MHGSPPQLTLPPLLALLSACAVGPRYVRPDLPERAAWSATAPGTSGTAADEPALAEVRRVMRERRHLSSIEEGDFQVVDLKEIARTLGGTTRLLTALLGAVAAVSLLVGGIGIMNIMLVSVTERTREIGIRLAIGALEPWTVAVAFLFSAAIGVGFGYFPARRAARLDPIEALRHE